MTPQEIRKIRLKNDYKQMCNIKGKVISWKPTKGEIPHIEEYEIIINVRGIVDPTPNYLNSHKVILTIPSNYPQAPPTVIMVSKLIYHPNWYPNGMWCSGRYSMLEGLGDFVIRMVRTIQYDLDITNRRGHDNRAEEFSWFLSNLESGLFPCDTTILPDPTKKKMIINTPVKKNFDIK